MSEKFDMKLVIDAVTTPLLHARLNQASSYRERAALLRSLAESALRGQESAGMDGAASFAAGYFFSSRVQPAAALSRPPEEAPRVLPEAAASVGPSPVDSGNGDPVSSYDVNEIADAFGSFV
ncbi:hypothetical protein BTH42_31690 [Burkholderia sp. SRS-W-2-2016]|uniref:hypothetical protein n=1 Tax=Burkholderia sp. SRS-W-2-2016 TaxID=1926878 RepID=UPI00094AA75A|nr:hypothetical protein [Burkholderia sp. SRS-W-2-2016]OLL27767.1 hypothetical protein BTH42_31690 [Burkholderia sp. SRS-W-2-2016]